MQEILENKIEITTIHHCKENGEVVTIERIVTQNGLVVFQDNQTPNLYFKCRDKIAALEEWLTESLYSKTEQINDIIEARREIIKQGRIGLFTFFNLRVKILQARFQLGFLKFKNFLLGCITS